MPGLLALAVLVSCELVSAGLRAEPDAESKAQAKALYERATRFYDVGKYGEAIADYQQAYLLTEDPVLLFDIGQSYRLWDRPDEAIRSYKNYLRKRPDASNRADVERKIGDLQKLLEERRRGDGHPAAARQPEQAMPADGDGYLSSPPAPIDQQANPQPEPPSGPATSLVAQPAPESPRKKTNWLAWGLIGGGGACLVVAGLAAAAGQQDANKLRDASKNGDTFDPTLEKNGKAANAIAYVGLAVGVVSAGVGSYLLWRGHSSKGPTTSLAPVVTPTYAGGSAVMAF
jgi:tetratricopeptide (TPR) repeat protein